MTQEGQGRYSDMKNAHYLENGWRQRLGYNRAPLGNGTWGIKWSTGRGRDTNMLGPLPKNDWRYALSYDFM